MARMGRYIVAELAEARLAISHKARLGVSSVEVVAGTIGILIKVTWPKAIKLILGHLGKVNSLLLYVGQRLHVWAVMEGAVAELGGVEVVS